MRSLLILLLSLVFGCAQGALPESVRLKDIGRIDGWRENHLVGFGIVTGLAGTGDSSRSKATRQSVANFLSNFDITITSDQINSRNVAIVGLMALLPPITHKGDRVDVLVNSLGDARSLVGGTLLLAPLKGPDGRVYALAQGAVSIGGYRYDQNGTLAVKNHPTAGIIPGGAQTEIESYATPSSPDSSFDFILSEPDYTTVQRISQAINTTFKQPLAVVKDSSAIHIEPTKDQLSKLSLFMATLENIQVNPDQRALVIINERTGTIVAGGNVKISKVTVAHGDLKVSIQTNYYAAQPIAPRRAAFNSRAAVAVPESDIRVNEDPGGMIELQDSSSVADLVTSLNRINVSTRDIIAILQGIKAAGALHADLILQ
jgi:flagellar P-ring protein precursor FlgI